MQILSCKLTVKQEFIGALHRILNYSRRGKPRRLWRLAVAPQPPIAEHKSYLTLSTVRGCVATAGRHSLLRLPAIGIPSPSLGSAKRDRLSSSTIYGKHKSPFRELIFGAYVPTAALLRSLQWVSL